MDPRTVIGFVAALYGPSPRGSVALTLGRSMVCRTCDARVPAAGVRAATKANSKAKRRKGKPINGIAASVVRRGRNRLSNHCLAIDANRVEAQPSLRASD